MDEIAKRRKTEKSGKKRAPTLQRKEPTLRRRLTPRRGILRRGEAEVTKWHPSGTPRHNIAASRCSYCS